MSAARQWLHVCWLRRRSIRCWRASSRPVSFGQRIAIYLVFNAAFYFQSVGLAGSAIADRAQSHSCDCAYIVLRHRAAAENPMGNARHFSSLQTSSIGIVGFVELDGEYEEC